MATYESPPSSSVVENPKGIAEATAETEPRREEALFRPHIHGMASSDFLPTNLMPVGNGMPMKKPRGNSSEPDMMNLVVVS